MINATTTILVIGSTGKTGRRVTDRLGVAWLPAGYRPDDAHTARKR